jgi:hypothetical protein
MSLAYSLSLGVALLMSALSIWSIADWERVYAGNETRLLPLLVGQDALNLVVGLPLLLGTMWLARRGSLLGTLLWPGALFYVAYDYGYYVLGLTYNAFFIPYIALVTASLYAAAIVVTTCDRERVLHRVAPAVPVSLTAGVLIGLAILFTVLWTALNLAVVTGAAALDPVVRVVTIMDLGLQLPALFAGGVLLSRRSALGFTLAAGLLLQAATYLAGLSAITLLQESLLGQPLDPIAVFPGFVVGAIGLALVAPFVRAARSSEGDPTRVRAREIRPAPGRA